MNNLTILNQMTSEAVPVVDEQQGQFLTFQVGKEKLGLNIHEVKEIIEISNITEVPMTPDYIRGSEAITYDQIFSGVPHVHH